MRIDDEKVSTTSEGQHFMKTRKDHLLDKLVLICVSQALITVTGKAKIAWCTDRQLFPLSLIE
jgi:hypothetical protein